jgi:uncharacterized protein (DUF58 family)
MRVTRRFRAVAGLAVGLAGLAVLLERPLVLVGAALLGAWLLAHQLLFVRDLARTDDALTVDQTVTPGRAVTDDPVRATLSLALLSGSRLAVEGRADPPVAATGSDKADQTVRLAPGGRSARTAFEVEFPVAGAFAFGRPTLTVRDSAGLYGQRLRRGPAAPVTVDPRLPRDLQVGEGGEGIAIGYGEHEAGLLGSAGLKPEGLREYVPGDAARRIDWKATARIGRPQIREFEAETDLVTLLVVDHRSTSGIGPSGERPIDYLREVALAVADSARGLNDPLGYYAVGDGGITERIDPTAAEETYARVRRSLRLLDPAVGSAPDESEDRSRAGPTPRRPPAPGAARRATSLLGEDRFGRALRPYFRANERYVERIEADPLFATVREALGRQRGIARVVLLADDADRTGVREAVKQARRGGGSVVVALAPRCLYEPGGLGDLEAVYDRYRDFEAFRRDLDRLEGVTALEVVPGDRVSAVLEDRRVRRVSPGD